MVAAIFCLTVLMATPAGSQDKDDNWSLGANAQAHVGLQVAGGIEVRGLLSFYREVQIL